MTDAATPRRRPAARPPRVDRPARRDPRLHARRAVQAHPGRRPAQGRARPAALRPRARGAQIERLERLAHEADLDPEFAREVPDLHHLGSHPASREASETGPDPDHTPQGDNDMAMKIRLARGGSKKRPHYSIVAADSRMPRDGRFIEKLGTYDPLLPKDNEDRVKIERRARPVLARPGRAADRPRRALAREPPASSPRRSAANPKKAEPGKKSKSAPPSAPRRPRREGRGRGGRRA